MKERMSYDKLATLIKQGFDQVEVQFVRVDEQLGTINGRLTRLETGVENINLRLDNVAYRFELNELDQRVSTLERKTGIS
ncbi:MAG: hypothetical protein AAB402_03405 [Patescibacteria group bacterium]